MYDSPDRHPRVSPAELAVIRSDPPDAPDPIPWISLFGYRQTWAYALGMFLASPVWWFYFYWLPKFLKNNHGIDLGHVFWPLLVVYLMADVGSIGGGGLSSWLIRAARASMLPARRPFWPALLRGPRRVRGAGHQSVGGRAPDRAGRRGPPGFSANLYTIVSDTVPRKAISSVVGIGGTAAGLGMLVLSTLIGRILDWTQAVYGEKDYLIPFVIAGSAYLMATAVIHLLLPRLEPMEFEVRVRNVGSAKE